MEGFLILLGLSLPFLIVFSFVMCLINSDKLKKANQRIDELDKELKNLQDKGLEQEPAKAVEKVVTPTPEVSKPFTYTPPKVTEPIAREIPVTNTNKEVLSAKIEEKQAPQNLKTNETKPTPKAASQNDPFEFIKNYLTQGNPIVKVAIVLLFFGCAFLMQYAHSRNLIPLWGKYAFASTLGLALTAIGWKLRNKRETYALLLQGGGLGILYITLFSAFRLHHLLGGTSTFALLAILSGISVSSAVLQNSRILAAFGLGGAFLAPILSSTGGGSHITLFSFYMVINISIFLISLKKDWRELNLLGFSFSLIIALLWANKTNWWIHTLSLEVFLYLFFALYFTIPIIQSYKKQFNKLSVNIFFALPVIITLLQIPLLKNYEQGLAWHLIAFTVIYAISSRFITEKFVKEQLRNVAIVCAYLSIPAFFSLTPTISLLALASAASLCHKELSQRLIERSCALISLTASFFMYIYAYIDLPYSPSIINDQMMTSLILSAAFFITALALRNNLKGNNALALSQCFAVFSVLIFYFNLTFQVGKLSDGLYKSLFLFLSSSIFSLIWILCSKFFRLPKLRDILHIHVAFTFISCFGLSIAQSHLFDDLWLLGLAPALGLSLYFLLQSGEKTKLDKSSLLITVASLIIPLSSSFDYLLKYYFPQQQNFLDVSGVAVTLIFTALTIFYPIKLIKDYRRSLLISFEIILVLFLVSTLSERPNLLVDFYIPLLNSYDFFQIITLALLIKMISFKEAPKVWITLYSFTGFFLANFICSRALYQYGIIDRYRLKEVIESSTAQVSYAILWSVTGIILMLISKRKGSALIWKFAAATFGLTVIKLFLIDLSGTDTVARILSFLAVGIIMLVIGYFFPCPPSKEKNEAPLAEEK